MLDVQAQIPLDVSAQVVQDQQFFVVSSVSHVLFVLLLKAGSSFFFLSFFLLFFIYIYHRPGIGLVNSKKPGPFLFFALSRTETFRLLINTKRTQASVLVVDNGNNDQSQAGRNMLYYYSVKGLRYTPKDEHGLRTCAMSNTRFAALRAIAPSTG